MREVTWRIYITRKVPPTICQVELIDQKELVKVVLDDNIETFVVHISFLSLGLRLTIYQARKAQIVLLLVEEVTIPAKYLDFTDVFSKELAEVLQKVNWS